MKKWLMLLCFCFFVFPAYGFASDIRFEAYSFTPKLGLDLHNGKQTLNLKDTLGIVDSDTVTGKVEINDRVRLTWLDLSYVGTKPLLESPWGDFQAGSDLLLRYGGIGLFLPIISTERYQLKGLMDVKYYTVGGRFGAFFSDSVLVSTDSMKFSGIAPSFGLAAAGKITDNLQVYGEASALPMGSFGYYAEGDIGIKYKVKDAAFFQAGYKNYLISTRNEALTTDLKTEISGPYFGLQYDFR